METTQVIKVTANIDGELFQKDFDSMQEAIRFQENLVFVHGIDSEIL